MRRSRDWVMDLAGLGILFMLFYFVWMGHYPFFIPDEGRYSEVAREMIESGDYITPRVNGVVFLDKPILYYWLQAIAMHLFGVNEWAVRFFPALCGILGCLATYLCGRTLYDRRTGILSAIILATTPLYYACAHYANLDLEVATWITCSLFLFLCGAQSNTSARAWLLSSAFIFAGLAFLTKGMIAIAFPGLIGLTWIVLTKRWHVLQTMPFVLGISLFLCVTLPWYTLVQMRNPAFLHYFFVTQQITRFLSAGTFNNPAPIWFYAPVVLLGFLPWTLFLLLAIMQYGKAKLISSAFQQNTLFFILWASIVFGFFSIPHSKTISYILPIFPPLALLVGRHLAAHWEQHKTYATLATMASVIFLLIVMMNAASLNDKSTKPLATELKAVLKPNDEVVNYFKFYQDIPLYLQQKITLVADWHSPNIQHNDNWVRELWYGVPFQTENRQLIDEAVFWQRFASHQRMFVFLNDNYFSQFKSHTKHYVILARYNDIILLSNQPVTLNKNNPHLLYN